MEEGTTLGALYLQLGIDPEQYTLGLELARQQAAQTGLEIERLLRGKRGMAGNLDLQPKVDFSQLHALNKLYDVKAKHARSVQSQFNRERLTPRVNTKPLDDAIFKLKQFEQSHRQASRAAAINTRVGVSTSASGSTAGFRSSGAGITAEDIGRAVAKAMRPSAISRAGGAISGIASAPLRAAGNVVGEVGRGLVYGATQQVAAGLGKGLSNALEKQVGSTLGSSELIGEKIGGALTNGLLNHVKWRGDMVGKFLEATIERIDDKKLKKRLQEQLEELKAVPEQVMGQAISTLGGGQAITREGLFQRGRIESERRGRTPVAQEQATAEWRESILRRDRIRQMASNAAPRFEKELASLQPRLIVAARLVAKLQDELDSLQRIDAPDDILQDTALSLRQASANASALANRAKAIQGQQDLMRRAVAESDREVRKSFARMQQVTTQRNEPQAFQSLFRQVAPGVAIDKMPALKVADTSLAKAGAISQYDPARNAIEVTRAMYAVIKKGALTPLQIKTLREELEHAVDADFGSYQGIQAFKNNTIVGTAVQPTVEEFAAIAPELGLYAPERRGLELNAKVKALRGTQQTLQEQNRQRVMEIAPTALSGKYLLQQKQSNLSGLIAKFQQRASDATNSPQEFIQKYQAVFDQLQNGIENQMQMVESAIQDAGSLEDVDVSGFENSIANINAYLRSMEAVLEKFEAGADKFVEADPNFDPWDKTIRRSARGMPGEESPRPASDIFVDPNFDAWAEEPKGLARVAQQSLNPRGLSASERAAEFGQRAGQMARTTMAATQKAFSFAQSVTMGLAHEMQQIPIAPLVQGMGTAAHALGVMAGGAYNAAQVAESIALDVLPMGRTAKGVIQHGVIPAAAFGAATHFLPGGQMAAEGLTHLAQGALAPLQHGVAGSLTQTATDALSVLPRIGGIQQAVIQLTTNAINQVVSTGTSAIAEAGVALLGGRAITTAASAPMKALAGRMSNKRQALSLPAAQQPAKIPLALPQPESVPIPAQTEQQSSAMVVRQTSTPQQRAANTRGEMAAKDARQKVNQMANQAGQVVGRVAGQIAVTAKDAIAEAKKMEAGFASAYETLKQAIKEGNTDLVRQYRNEIEDMAEKSKAAIDDLIKAAKDSGASEFGSDALTKLGGIKGRFTQRQNNIRRQLAKFDRTRAESGEDISAQALDPARIALPALNATKVAIQQSVSALNQITAQLAKIEASDNLGDTLREAIQSDAGKDLITNAGGYAGSLLGKQLGPVGELSGDLIGALLTRQAIEVGGAGKRAISRLQADEAYKAASALQKFRLLLEELNREMQSQAFSQSQSTNLFGDLTGFTIGNLTANSPMGFPLSGALAASATVPQLQKMRDAVLAKLQEADPGMVEATGEDLKAQKMLDFSRRGINPSKTKNPAERAYLEDVLRLLNDAINAADRYDAAIKQAMRAANKEYEQSAEAVQKLVNPDFDELNQRVEESMRKVSTTMDEIDNTIQSRDTAAIRSAAEGAQQQEFMRQAYAELDMKDPDTIALGIDGGIPQENKFLKALSGDLSDLINKFPKLAKGAALAAGAFAILSATPIIGFLREFASRSLSAAAALESMQAQFRFNFGAESADRLDSVTESAVSLRQNILQTRQAYLEFAAATKGTPLENVSDLASQAINQAALVQGLDPERQQRAQVAITQIASKGRLSAEEVRGQLAEALPGSTAIFARSQGMTVREFSRALDQGQFSAEDALPKFLAQLQAETGSGVADAVNTTAAAMTNLNNQTQLLQESVGKGLQPVQKLGINALASGLALVRTVIEPVIQLLGAVAIAALGKFAMSLAASGAAAKGFGASIAFAQSGLKGFFALLNSPANSMAGWAIGIFGAMEAFKIISTNFKDAGGAARQFAQDSEKALRDYDRNVQNTKRNPFGVDFGAPSSLETGVVGSILGTEGSRFVEQTGQNLLREGFRYQSGANKGEVMNVAIPEWVPGLGGNNFAPGTTLAEKQAQDRELAFDDAAKQSGIVIDRIRSATRGQSAQEIVGLNSRIRDIQTRRNALTPDRANDQERARLTEEERRLTNQRTKLEEPLRFLSGRNAAAVELFRKARAEATDEQSYQEANAQLQMAIKAQEELNRLMNLAAKSAAQMKIELEQVVGKLAEANQQNEILAANSRANVAENQLAGISEGVAAYQSFINAQTEASTKIAANNEAIAKTAQMLADVNVQRVLTANNFTSESSPADIRAKAAQMGEGEDRDLLEQAASQIETINNTRLDNANTNAQLKEAQAQYVTRIRELAKSVLDFYRGIEQQAAETALATQQSIVQANTTAAQTRLRATLIGFQESFTNDFVNALIDLVETLNKPLNDAIAAQQQILSAQSQYFQTLQQATNLQQQLPQSVPINAGDTALGGQPQVTGTGAGSLPVQGGTIAGAMPGVPGAIAVPNTLAGQSPNQIMGALQGFNSMDLNAAARFSGQGIQQGVSLAGANYQMTVGNIQRQLQQQQAMAAIEADMGRSNARLSLFRANREMQQQGIGIGRSVQDLALRGQVQTPEVEFQQQRLQLDREFEDQIRSFSDFQRGLSQTIQQQEMLRGMIQSGQLPGMEEFLPDIEATISNARNEFSMLNRNIVDYRQAYENALAQQAQEFRRAEESRRFEAAQRIANAQVSGLRGEAQLARNQGRAGLGRSLDFRASAEELNINFRAQIKELEDLRYNNILTAEEFDNLKAAAERANSVSMQNLIEETDRAERQARLAVQQRLASTEAGLMRSRAALSGIRGDDIGSQRLNLEAQMVETRAGLSQQMEDLRQLRSEVGLTNREYALMAEQIKTTNRLDMQALKEQMNQLGQGITYSLNTMRQMESFGRKLSNETPAFGVKTEYSTTDLLRAAMSPTARQPGGLFAYASSGKFSQSIQRNLSTDAG